MSSNNTQYIQYSIQRNGVSMIETLVLLFVFSVMTLSFYTAYSVGLTRIIDSRNRLQAASLASEQMEQVRNLPYHEVRAGTSVPGCDTDTETCYIDDDYTVTLNNVDFQVQTSVSYQDDAEDGTQVASTDDVPTDYKHVTVMVSWSGGGNYKEIKLVSRFVPPGLETGLSGTGTLSVNVLDYAGQPLEDVDVTIVNNDVSPVVNLQETTGSDGNILLYGVLVDDAYEFTLTHHSNPGSYETVQTCSSPCGTAPDTYTPIDAHVPVIEAVLNTATFEFNTLSSVEIHSVDPYGNALPDIDFSLVGGRRLDVGADPAVYNYDATHVTDGSGELTVPDSGVGLSGGTYTVALDASETGYTFWKMDPSGSDADTLYLNHGVTPTSSGEEPRDIVLIDNTANGFFITVADNDTGFPIVGATVDVTDPIGTAFDQQTTDAYGQVYFPGNESDVFTAGIYTVDVASSGYTGETINPEISSGLEDFPVNLNPDS